MLLLTYIIKAFLGRWFTPELPDHKSIDKTGLVLSDHPYPVNGWIKGWVLDSPDMNIVLVCKHSLPSKYEPNNKVFVINKFGHKVERKIVEVLKLELTCVGDSTEERKDRIGGDITLCRVDQPFPSTVSGYKFSSIPDKYTRTVTVTPRGVSRAQIFPYTCNAWLKCKRRDSILLPEDSGTPWFVWEKESWRVASHTSKGGCGEGPCYANPSIREAIRHGIAKLNNHKDKQD